MQRHEIPTHLEVEDKILGSLTVRQLLFLAVGVSLSYGLWGLLRHASPAHLPLIAAILLAAIPALCTLVLALVQPGGRPFEEWLLTLVRFATLPHVCLWRPLSDERPASPRGEA
jgi:PrgI family protein